MSGTFHSCPHCDSTYGICLLGINSGLGSDTYVCASCEKLFLSGRYEWVELSRVGKTLYCVASVAYSVFLGAFGGIVCKGIFQFITEGPRATEVDTDGPLFWIAAILIAAMVALIQYLRVLWSLQRSSKIEKTIFRTAFFSVHVNLQMLSVLSFIAISGVGWLVAWYLHKYG